MSPRQWHHRDSDGKTTPTSIGSSFTITAPPKTDVWRPSESEDRFNAPFTYTVLSCAQFKKLAVTVSAEWKTLYDQGGLMLYFPSASNKQHESKWIKLGIEFFDNKPALSVVGNDRFSDWSLSPLPVAARGEARLEAERKEGTLWVYSIVDGGRTALREIKWAFLEAREKDAEMWVGAYAAKPTPEKEGDTQTGIDVVFRDFELDAGSCLP